MIVYGRNPVREAIRGPRAVRRVWATHAAAREPWLRGEATSSGEAVSVEVTSASAEEIRSMSSSDAHQGVCAEVEPFRYATGEGVLGAERPLIVALDQVQDPQNLGAICRTADCAGATGVVIPERRAADVSSAVCKASAGAVEHLPVARVRNLADFLGDAKTAGAWVYGAEASASSSYESADYSGPLVLVLGSEGRGLRSRVAANCDLLVSIPLRGAVASLNVSAAAAILLYEAARSRSPAT